jgi:hypothetical protein
MAIWYVDSSVATSGNGQSWATAWKAITNIAGLAAGDTVYFSGGPNGGAGQSYPLPAAGWTPISGTAGNPITYQIGQDSAHNGNATFSGTGPFISGTALAYFVISGQLASDPPFVLSRNPSPNQHFKLGSLGAGAGVINADHGIGLTFSNINCGQQTGGMIGGNPIQTIQIDHCYFYKLTSATDDSIIWLNMPMTLPFDDTKIFLNTIYSPYPTNIDGWGDDVFGAANYSGVSIHDNLIIAYPITTYLAQQHMDGWQPIWAAKLKFFNNYVENMTNFGFYADLVHGDGTNLYVFNNILALTDPIVQNFNSPRGIVVGAEGISANMSNIVVAHNSILDYTFHEGTAIGESGKGGGGTNVYGANIGVWNNIATNNTCAQATFGDDTNPSVANAGNVNFQPMPTGAGVFVSYTQNRADLANLHLVSTATALIGHGTNLSSQAGNCPEIMFDRDGVARPASGPWDIGPYQYVGGPPKISIGIAIGSSVQSSLKTIRRARANLK